MRISKGTFFYPAHCQFFNFKQLRKSRNIQTPIWWQSFHSWKVTYEDTFSAAKITSGYLPISNRSESHQSAHEKA